MIRKIVTTFSGKLLTSVISFFIVILSTKFLGADGRGEISIIMLNITIINMISNIFGGTALIYLLPRTSFFKLFVPATIWSFLSSFIFSFLLFGFNLIPSDHLSDILILSLLSSLAFSNIFLLIGKEKIKEQNIVSIVQVVLLFSVLAFEIYIGNRTVSSYIFSLYISYGLSLMLSIFYLRNEIKVSSLKNISPVLRQILKYGFYVQFAALIQVLNYRFSFYILNQEYGKSTVGIYSVAVSLADIAWLASRSISLVQYARISNMYNTDHARLVTLKLAKFSFSATVIMLVALVVLPPSFYEIVFGKNFGEVRKLLLFSFPGIAFLGFTMILSHYFAGIGKHYVNTIASSIGFIATVLLAYILIPKYKSEGAALTASCSYLCTGFFVLYIFIRESKFKVKELIPSIADFRFFYGQLKDIYTKKRFSIETLPREN